MVVPVKSAWPKRRRTGGSRGEAGTILDKIENGSCFGRISNGTALSGQGGVSTKVFKNLSCVLDTHKKAPEPLVRLEMEVSCAAMLSPSRVSLSHAVHWLLTAVLLLLGMVAVVQPSRYLLLFTSKGSLFFVCGAGIVLAYFLLREDRASGPRN